MIQPADPRTRSRGGGADGPAAMCGAPVLLSPLTTMRFDFDDRPAAARATGTCSPTPSTSSGTCAPPSGTPAGFFAGPPPPPCAALSWQQLVAEAERGLAAAARRVPPPSRKSRRGSAATANKRGGAPPPPPIKMRVAPEPPVLDLVPPQIKMRVALEPPVMDLTDPGSSAPSTPSDCSWETTPSPRGPLPVPAAFFSEAYSAALSSSKSAMPAWQQLPPRPFVPALGPPRVEVRQVWARNLDQEAQLIESLLPKFPYVALDTEFPGTVYRPAGPVHGLALEERYGLLRRNVDALELIQLGLTLFDAGGRIPGLGGAARYVWEFNLREFDVRRHRHAPESIALLRDKGVDFDRSREHGVEAAALGPRLRKWLRDGLGRAGVATFSGGYDLAYLVKMMFGPGYRMPEKAEEFEGTAKALLRWRSLFDVKEMAGHCPIDLRGGLSTVAVKLNVERAVGEAHKAGSDSLLTCHVFLKMRESFFDGDDKLAKVAGIITGITA